MLNLSKFKKANIYINMMSLPTTLKTS